MTNATRAVPAEVVEHKAAQAQHRVLGDMLARSATDGAFRALMLNDPHTAFAQFGATVPADLDVVFIENKHDLTIVLPDALDDLGELSETELQELSGGSWGALVLSLELAGSPTWVAGSIIAVAVISIAVYVTKS